MVLNPDTQRKPIQPMGWPAPAWENQARQQRQEADRQRVRADQLERRNRRLRSAAGMSWALFVTVAITAAAIGAMVGFAFGSGLLGWTGR